MPIFGMESRTGQPLGMSGALAFFADAVETDNPEIAVAAMSSPEIHARFNKQIPLEFFDQYNTNPRSSLASCPCARHLSIW
jgi:hypothetical protein